MITIYREGTQVRIKIKGNYPIHNLEYTAILDAEKDGYALLLTDHFNQALSNRLEAIRKKAYEQGWNDKRKKQPKKTWQSSSIEL